MIVGADLMLAVMLPKTFLILLTPLTLYFSAVGKTGDPLHVQFNNTEAKVDANYTSDTLAILEKGQKLIEIYRQRHWVMVSFGEKGEKTGWVLETTIARDPPVAEPLPVTKEPSPSIVPVNSVKENEPPAALGQTLYVSKESTQLKSDPSGPSKVVLSLKRGHKLMKIGEKGNWTMVGAEETGGVTGWVPTSDISNGITKGKVESFKTEEFAQFEKAFWQLEESAQKKGFSFFTDAEYMGDGIVKVVATSTWFSAPSDLRNGNLQTIYNLWKSADGSGLPIAVYVYDESGKLRMQRQVRASYPRSSTQPMPKIYKLQKLDLTSKIWRYYPHPEDYAYWVGEDEKSARRNAAIGSTPPGKVFFKSPWMDSQETSCVLDYDSGANEVAGVERKQ